MTSWISLITSSWEDEIPKVRKRSSISGIPMYMSSNFVSVFVLDYGMSSKAYK